MESLRRNLKGFVAHIFPCSYRYIKRFKCYLRHSVISFAVKIKNIVNDAEEK